MMKKILMTLLCACMGVYSFAQFDGIIVEEVDNGGVVPGKTYRVYVKVKNAGDGVDIVFGAPGNELMIESTKPFYQHKDGGMTSKDISNDQALSDPKLKYDSFVTIGRLTDADNELAIFKVEGKINLDPKEFEAGKGLSTADGAWYCIPGKPQTVAGDDKKVLIMQLTTKGVITGQFNLQGKLNREFMSNPDDNNNWRQDAIRFTCGG